MNTAALSLMTIVTAIWLAVGAMRDDTNHANSSQIWQVKCTYLVNFTKFVIWPASSFSSETAPVVIGIVGADPFGQTLDQMAASMHVGRRAVEVRRFESLPAEAKSLAPGATDVGQLRACHVVFVNDPKLAIDLAGIDALKRAAVLTVSDQEGFAARGGMIELAMTEQKLELRVNRQVAESAGLKVSANLLKLATIVSSTRGSGSEEG